MGRFFEYQRDHINYDLSTESDWFLGNLDRFKFSYIWIDEDHIWWRDDHVQNPKQIPRIEIRKWCESYLEGDILVRRGSATDKYMPDPKKIWEYSHYHKYWVEFSFETEEDLSHFLLKWID